MIRALQNLRPDAQWVIRGDQLEWLDTVQTEPTAEEIAAELANIELQDAKDAKIKIIDTNTANAIEALVGDNNKQKDKLGLASYLMKKLHDGTLTAQETLDLDELNGMWLQVAEMKTTGNNKEAAVQACTTIQEVEAVII